VKESPSDPAYGRTNWRKFAISIGVPLAVATGLVIAMEQGAIAASFAVSGNSFKLSADELKGTGFTQYSDAIPQTTNADGGGRKVTAISGIDSATITKLCQTVTAPSPFGGSIVMRIDAGKVDPTADAATQEAQKVKADHLLIGMSDLQGDATFTNIKIGVDAQSMGAPTVPGSAGPAAGGFGQQSDGIDIKNLKQTATYTSAGTFTLTGMHLRLFVGSKATDNECFAG
jgi:hypothetical protein